MTTIEPSTPEMEALHDLLDKNREVLSEPAKTILKEAGTAAHAAHQIPIFTLNSAEYDEHMWKMRTAAKKITHRDREVLMEIVRAVNAAADSIDPDDDTPFWLTVTRGDRHWYYKMISGMIEDTFEKLDRYYKTAVDRIEEDIEEGGENVW